MVDDELKRIQFEVRNPQAAAYSKMLLEKDVIIKQLRDALRKACGCIADYSGSCPLDEFDWKGCLEDECVDNRVNCYVQYYLEKGEK